MAMLYFDVVSSGNPGVRHAGVNMPGNWPEMAQLTFKLDDGDIETYILSIEKAVENTEHTLANGITDSILNSSAHCTKDVLSLFLGKVSDSKCCVMSMGGDLNYKLIYASAVKHNITDHLIDAWANVKYKTIEGFYCEKTGDGDKLRLIEMANKCNILGLDDGKESRRKVHAMYEIVNVLS